MLECSTSIFNFCIHRNILRRFKKILINICIIICIWEFAGQFCARHLIFSHFIRIHSITRVRINSIPRKSCRLRLISILGRHRTLIYPNFISTMPKEWPTIWFIKTYTRYRSGFDISFQFWQINIICKLLVSTTCQSHSKCYE